MKDHEIRELVNQLRDVAIKYHGTDQLREHIARTVRAAILQAEPVTTANKLPELIEGMEVSIDVSTCDADAGNRYFGTVAELSELDGAKNGYILLVQDAKPNFNQSSNSPVIPDDSEDTKRLNWLDAQNKRLNEYYGTSYGWKFDANFQRNAMMLNDSNYPVMTVRQAIDEAIAAAPQEVRP